MTLTKNKYFILILGCALLFFSGTSLNLSITAFLWPACFILFVRKNTNVKSILLTLLLFDIVKVFSLGDMVGTGSFVLSGAYVFLISTITFLPFVLDGYVTKNSKSLLNLLVYPLALATMELGLSLVSITLINNLAMAQVKNRELIQIVSIIGTFGLDVIIALSSSTIAYVVENFKDKLTIKKVTIGYLSLMFVVMAYGGFRTSKVADYDNTLRVAMAAGPIQFDENGEWFDVGQEENIRYLKESIIKAKEADAKVISFCEEAFFMYGDQKETFVSEISKLTKEYGIYANVPLEIEYEDDLFDNISLFFNDKGEQIIKYTKSNLVPVIETGYYKKGDSVIPTSDINGSKIASTICFDGDFPNYIRTMDSDVDIWFNPSWEWPTNIVPFIGTDERCHYYSLTLRAIENGVNLVKPTSEGDSVVVDYYGNIIAHSRDVTSNICVADVSTSGIKTIYNIFGGFIDLAYPICLVAVCGLIIKNKRK